MSNCFSYNKGVLHVDSTSIEEIIAQSGTPTYIYNGTAIDAAYQNFAHSLSGVPHIICYAVKANNSLAVLTLLGRQGAGADVVSGGELYKALKAGIPANRIVFSGVGKTRDEIEYAIDREILMFNIECEQELIAIDTIAKTKGKRPFIGIRVNPDISARTHPYISTGLKDHKFGIPIKRAASLFKVASRLRHLEPAGISCHIGSQILSLKPFRECFQSLMAFYDRLVEQKITVRYLNLGGGLGIRYRDEVPPSVSNYVKVLRDCLGNRPLTVILEPGRAIVGSAGVLVSRVIRVKRGDTRNFIIIDAGMNDLIRPALYDAYHEVLAVHKKQYKQIRADLVGPVCESSDSFAIKRRLPNFQPGDLVAIMTAGAYGFTMSSNYNARPRPAEVLVQGRSFAVVREREQYRDLTNRETVPSFLGGN